MASILIGVALGLLLVVLLVLLNRIDKKIIYGLVLSGIGFLYIGYTWTNLESFIINSIQAVVFVLFAYFGIVKSIYILAIGYFLHGIWDLTYDFLGQPDLLPPHYDLFCLSVDFTIGIYLLIFARSVKSKFKIITV
jgi:hypothetical protein